MALTLTTDERTELERRASSRTIRAEDAKRAKVILMLADGTSHSTFEATLWCYRDYINRWRRRFVAGRLDGLRSAHKGQKPSVLTPALEARILAKTQQRPPGGSTHWSTRKLARGVEDPSQPCTDGVNPRPYAAASVRTLYAVGRSRLRTQGHGRDRPLPESATACGRVLQPVQATS